MLRILGPAELEGYVLQGTGGPRWELLSGVVSMVQETPETYYVTLRGKNLENGVYVWRSATVAFRNRGAGRDRMKTRFVAAGIQTGMFLSVLSMQRNNERIAKDFKFSGLWRLKGYKGEKNVILGKYTDPKIQEGLVSIRFLDYNPSRRCYYRRTVDITDRQILPAAKENFYYKADKNACICICGPERKEGGMSIYHCDRYEMLDVALGKPM